MAAEYRLNIENWVDTLKFSGANSFAQQLLKDNGHKSEVLNRVEQAGLPHYPRIVLGLENFLENPDFVLNNFKHSLYWASLLPRNTSVPKSTKLELIATEVINFAQEHKQLSQQYDVLISLYEKNIYGGNIISNQDIVYIELISDDQIHIAQGTTKPGEPFVAQKRKSDISFSYSVENLEIRQLFWRALRCIQIENTDSERQTDVKFMPGYFEFAITTTPSRPTLGVYFFDYKTSPSFTSF